VKITRVGYIEMKKNEWKKRLEGVTLRVDKRVFLLV